MKLLLDKLLFLFLLFSGCLVIAQKHTTNQEIKKIDSLIDSDDFENAQKKTTYLYNQLKQSNQQSELLELQFRQALIYNEDANSSIESLKILLKIIDEVEAKKLHSLAFRIYLLTALAYEKSDHLSLTNKYLNKALKKCKDYKLEELYSTYCIRRSSYCRFIKKLDSMNHFAQQAERYATKYGNEKDLLDSYLLMGIYNSKKNNYDKALKFALKILEHKKKNNQHREIAIQYNNISFFYLKMKEYRKALLYNDSAYIAQRELKSLNTDYLPEIRYQIYEALGNKDSTFHYFKQYHNDKVNLLTQEEKLKINTLEKQYHNDEKEATIKNKDKQMILIGILLTVIIIALILLFIKNRQVSNRNKIINEQLGEFSKLLEQKQMLLSELQHRVKNNLQHVISILEIQKESANFNNIDELIRGNQNRIHSMALLHKKLNMSDNVNDVDFTRYINELTEVVKESYNNHKKKINLNILCEIEIMAIEKALPIGLIIVELVSNSIKHAFKKRSIGIINLEITKIGNKNQLYYSDNGYGFDFNKTNEQGLGIEIIKGLIDQLDGIAASKQDNGFELRIIFN